MVVLRGLKPRTRKYLSFPRSALAGGVQESHSRLGYQGKVKTFLDDLRVRRDLNTGVAE